MARAKQTARSADAAWDLLEPKYVLC